MFKQWFGSSKQKKAAAVFQRLQAIAVQHVTDRRFEQNNALVRAYMVALGITVPHHVVSTAFLESVFPKWEDSVWRKDVSVFLDLAAMLSWRQCLAAFADLPSILKPDSVEAGRQDLMRVAGLFPASDRAYALMRRYELFERNPETRREFFDGTPLSAFIGSSAENLKSVGHSEIHAWMVNEALDQPSLFQNDPQDFHKLIAQITFKEFESTMYFKERARELLAKHIEAGRP